VKMKTLGQNSRDWLQCGA